MTHPMHGTLLPWLPPGLKPLAGAWLSNSLNGQNLTTTAMVADVERITPWLAPWDVTIDQAHIAVSTALAGNAKVTIYATDANGRPTTRLYESGDISTAATGSISVALAASFGQGKRYWWGVRASSASTLRSPAGAACVALAYDNAATPAALLCLQRTLAYATPATDWAFDNTQLVTTIPPLIRLRVA